MSTKADKDPAIKKLVAKPTPENVANPYYSMNNVSDSRFSRFGKITIDTLELYNKIIAGDDSGAIGLIDKYRYNPEVLGALFGSCVGKSKMYFEDFAKKHDSCVYEHINDYEPIRFYGESDSKKFDAAYLAHGGFFPTKKTAPPASTASGGAGSAPPASTASTSVNNAASAAASVASAAGAGSSKRTRNTRRRQHRSRHNRSRR